MGPNPIQKPHTKILLGGLSSNTFESIYTINYGPLTCNRIIRYFFFTRCLVGYSNTCTNYIEDGERDLKLI